MRKVILAAIALMAFSFTNAQEGKFKVGVHTGLPIGNNSDLYSVNLGFDVAYLWNVTDKFTLGATTGFSNYFGKETSFHFTDMTVFYVFADASFVPIAATGQYSLSDKFFVGADLGYAISVGKGNGGILYQPKFGYQNEKIELYLAYKGISYSTVTDYGLLRVDGLSSLNLGFNYKL